MRSLFLSLAALVGLASAVRSQDESETTPLPRALTDSRGNELLPSPRLLASFDLSEYIPLAKAKTWTPKANSAPRIALRLGLRTDDKMVIREIDPTSSAAISSIRVGDKLVRFDARDIATPAELREALSGCVAGQLVELTLKRDDKVEKASLKLVPVSDPMGGGPNNTARRTVLGVQTSVVEGGIQLEAITPGSAADKAGLKNGDIIRELAGRKVASREVLTEILSARSPGDKVPVLYQRNAESVRSEIVLSPGEDAIPAASWDTRRGTFRKGVYRLAVVTIDFPDVHPNPKITTADWEASLFSRDKWTEKSPTGEKVHGSMADYYREISCDRMKLEGKVFEAVKVKKNRVDYGTTTTRSALLEESLDLVKEKHGKDALKGFDGVFFLYAGNRASTQRTSLYWPHRSTFNYKGERLSYFVCPEGADRMFSISTIAHEFGHMLGLPDLYAKPEVPEMEGVGVWCTMANGHGNDGKPLHFSAWSKEQMGWLKPTLLDPAVPQKIVLKPIEGMERECVKVPLREDGTEYLLLENRTRKGYDRDLPGEGLLIWRIVDSKPFLEESHGIAGPEGPRKFLSAVPYPSKANNSYTPLTVPSSRSMKGAGGKEVWITNITRLPDGRVTFQIGYEYY